MKRTDRLAPVQRLMSDTADRRAAQVARVQRRQLEAEVKLAELERYQADYERAFRERAAVGTGAARLRDNQVFLARLGEAVQQQRQLVERCRQELLAERTHFTQAATRSRALDNVVEQWNREERREADRREQRDSDEQAGSAHARPK